MKWEIVKDSYIRKCLIFVYEHTGEFGILCHHFYITKIKRVPYFGRRFAANQGGGARAETMRYFIAKEVAGKNSCEILEIGSWAGQSAILCAGEMKKLGVKGKIICVDPWAVYAEMSGKKHPAGTTAQRMTAAVKNDKIFKLFLNNVKVSGHSDVITYHRDYSEKYLPTLPAEVFDIVYIDGSHLYKDVKNDIENSTRVLKIGGIICGDDLELQVPELDKNIVLDKVRQGVGDEYLEVPTHMGVTVAIWDVFKRKVSSVDGFWAMRKTTSGYENVEI